jgi:hypothetical protein
MKRHRQRSALCAAKPQVRPIVAKCERQLRVSLCLRYQWPFCVVAIVVKVDNAQISKSRQKSSLAGFKRYRSRWPRTMPHAAAIHFEGIN